MPSPILTLWEVVGGTPVPVVTLDFSTIDRGASSVEKIIRIYNNKDGAGVVDPARQCKLTIASTDGGDSNPFVQGTSPDFQPCGRARCTTLCNGAKDVELGIGDGLNNVFQMPRGGNNLYVTDSMVVHYEIKGGQSGNSARWTGGSWNIVVLEAGPSEAQPITFLPPTIQPIPGGTEYSTVGAVISYAGANPVIILDSDPSGPNAGKTPPAGDTEFVLQFRYKVEAESVTVDASGSTATVTLPITPESQCLVWGDWTYVTPEISFEVVGGSAYRIDIGGLTTVAPEIPGLDQIVAQIPDQGYAEIVMRLDIPSNFVPSPRIPFKLKLSTEV